MNSGTVKSSLKVVLDTNIFISALVFGGKPEEIYRLVLTKKLTAYISPIILAEIIEILTKRFNFNQIRLRQIERKIRKSFMIVNPTRDINVIRDPDDDRILEAAIEGNCDYIVTGDKDLLDLKKYKKIKILTSEQFLSEISPFIF